MTRSGSVRAPRRSARSAESAAIVGLGHAAVASTATGACYWLLASDQRLGHSPVSTLLLQASGAVALIWAYAGLVLGLAVSIRQPNHRSGAPRRMSWRPAVVNWHRQLNVAVVALTLVHALTYAIGVPGGTWLVALVPWTAHPEGLGYTLGVLGLYLLVRFGAETLQVRRDQLRTPLLQPVLAAVGAVLIAAAVALNGWSPWATLLPGIALTGAGGWAFFSTAGLDRIVRWTSFAFQDGQFSAWHVLGATLTLGLLMLGASLAATVARAGGRWAGRYDAGR